MPPPLLQLIHQREAEDVGHLEPEASGPSAGSPASQASRAGSQRLDPASLPPSLQSCLVPASAVQYQHRADGSLAELGEGARWALGWVVAATGTSSLPACSALCYLLSRRRVPPPAACSGRVVKAQFNGEMVAAKELDVGKSQEAQEAFLTEAQHLLAMRHENIVSAAWSWLAAAALAQRPLLLVRRLPPAVLPHPRLACPAHAAAGDVLWRGNRWHEGNTADGAVRRYTGLGVAGALLFARLPAAPL